ncbi:HAD-IA family hydrolase [Patescibacteria group bacterium]|nr:HAD-IA family hydrolase [Patescibacteria group bacterium]
MAIKYKGREIEAIVLDFDGTFYSNKKLELKIWTNARKKLVQILINKSVRVDIKLIDHEELLDKYIQLALEKGWENAFIEFGGDIDDFNQIIYAVTKAEFLKFNTVLSDFLQELLKYVPIYIFTGSSRKTVIDALQVLTGELWVSFADNLLASDDMKIAKKPHIAAYEEMLQVFGLDATKTIFVDDQEVEVDAAAKLGIITFLIRENVDKNASSSLHTLIGSLCELQNHLTFE